jgi:hypothetical protein
MSRLNDPQRAEREAALAELVGLAHWTRAKQNARKYAHDFQRPVYIVRAWKPKGYAGGFVCDIVKPTVQDYWRVTPNGDIENVKAGR